MRSLKNSIPRLELSMHLGIVLWLVVVTNGSRNDGNRTGAFRLTNRVGESGEQPQ